MGKASRNKKNRDKVDLAVVDTDVPEKQPSLSRRSFMGGVAAGSVILAGGAGLYSFHNAITPESGGSDTRFMTTSEAAVIYNGLKDTLVQKHEQAKAQGRPLKIFLLESHTSVNALAREMMVLDIAKKLGIGTLILEQPNAGMENLQRLNQAAVPDKVTGSHTKMRTLLAQAEKKGFALRAMDNRFHSAAEGIGTLDRMTGRIAEETLENSFGKKVDISVRTTNFEQNQFEYSFTGEPAIVADEAFRKLANETMQKARADAFQQIMREREPSMMETIGKEKDAVIVTGAEHGRSLAPFAKRGGSEVVAILLADPQTDKELKMLTEGKTGDDAANLQWAMDPANALHSSVTKDFNPQNLELFIDATAKKANSMTKARSH